jgi:hypothetical protein
MHVADQRRTRPGYGWYVLLSRTGDPGADAVVTLATSAARYSSTQAAWVSFAQESAGSYDSRPALLPDGDRGDDIRVWQQQGPTVAIQEILLHRRNFLVSLTLVRLPPTGATDVVAHYFRLLEAKVHD